MLAVGLIASPRISRSGPLGATELAWKITVELPSTVIPNCPVADAKLPLAELSALQSRQRQLRGGLECFHPASARKSPL